MKTVKKKQKHKGKGQTRVVSTTVKSDSFFNFFETVEAAEMGNKPEGATEDDKDDDETSKGEI